LIKHTFPHSSFSDEKLTPTTLADLVCKVEQRLGNMEVLVEQAVETTESVRQDFRDDMVNAQSAEDEYRDVSEKVIHDFFARMHVIGGDECPDSDKVKSILDETMEA
jgi:hypothetical protein